MGIQQTKTLLKTYYSKPSPKDPDDYLQKGFCPEALQITEFLDNFWDTSANEHFDWTNIQENKKFEEINKEKEKFYLRENLILPELPDNKTIRDNIFSIDTLSENKEAYNPSETKDFSEFFIKRMNIILFAYVKKIISTLNESSSLDCMAKYFESNKEPNEKKIFYDLGMSLFVRMLEDQTLTKANKKLKEETLDFMLNSLIFVRPLNFYGETKEYFMLDNSLDQIVNYLKKIISDENEEKNLRIKSYKILLNLALAKGSLKNLLDFVKFYDYLDDYIDLNTEINIFKNEFIKLSLSHPTDSGTICKSKLWNFKLSQKKKKEGANEESKLDSHLSMTTDGSYIFIFSSAGFIIKIGSGYNNTMLGNVYLTKENFRAGEKGTISLVENILYYRSSSLDPDPLIMLDADNLNEIKVNYCLNLRQPNHLWIEGKKNEFEFPHNTYKDMNEIIEKKKNMGAEDKPNVRPQTASPISTDGRYIYVLSKWFDDYDSYLEKAADDDDDEPKNINKKPIISIFGIDVYDPLNDMCNIKSIKLTLESQKTNPGKNANNADESLNNPDLLSFANMFYTNGNIAVIGKYKFSLITGEEIERDVSSDLKTLPKSTCYDLTNNVIWAVSVTTEANNQEKLFIICYFNHSAKPIIEYPVNHPKYMPCSLEKIINLAEENIFLQNLSDKISIKKFQREDTLNILNLRDDESEKFKTQNLVLEGEAQKEEISSYKISIKCLILSTIAKLSEYYGQVPDIRSANTDEERGQIFSKACRRPYCVKLESEIFETLIFFINNFSENFFKILNNEYNSKSEVEDKTVTDKENSDLMNYLDSYCLLSTIKILRTNLSCLSLSNLDLKFFIKDNNNNPFLKVKEFIFKILEIYNKKISLYEKNGQDMALLPDKEKKNFEIIKALYEECKIILLVSVNTLYPDYNDIIQILETEIRNFKTNNYSREVVNCILEWMSSEENMKNLLSKLKNNEINKIFEIFRIVSSWEVKKFSDYLNSFKDFNQQMPKYSELSTDEITAFKFSSNIQTEILKSISKKLLNENYDEIENEYLLQSFSEIIFDNLLMVFKNLRSFLDNIKALIKDHYNLLQRKEKADKFIDDEEVIDTCIQAPAEESSSNNYLNNTENPSQENKSFIPESLSLEQFTKMKIKEIWNHILDKVLTKEFLLMKIANFHIDSLSILTSNFILSSLMLNSFNNLISEMNQIYSIIKELEGESQSGEWVKEDYKEMIIESDHPYKNNENKWFTIDLQGENEIFLEFDPQCEIKANCGYINMYFERNSSTYVFPNHVNLTTNFPKETLTCKNPIEVHFYIDSCNNSGSLYGFKLKIHNGKKKGQVISNDKFTNFMRSLCWVSCKCSAQLLRGNFTKAVSSGNDEDDLKYNNLLSSKLFAGGLDFEEIRKENDQNISNVLGILEKIIPESQHDVTAPNALTEKSLLYSILNGENESANKLIVIMQKKFSEEIIWAHIGGHNADRLVRAAFAALLRHSGQTNDFKKILDLIEFHEETYEDKDNIDEDRKIDINSNEKLIKEIKNHPKFLSIYKKWQAASRMRTWLVEKKKNVDEALEKSKPSNVSAITTTQSKKDDNTQTTGSSGELVALDSVSSGNNSNLNKPSSEINKDLTDKNQDNNSEEIMNKIIEQTIIKAKFLIKLNPSPAFIEKNNDEFNRKSSSSVLIRSSSLELGSQNIDDSWKTRLNQWKLLQKSKKIIKSVEEEANDNLYSLTSSVLLTLQSTISSKRLFNKIKIATLRAKAREIGLKSMKKIFEEVSHFSLMKDLLSWFCASLRKADTKICHYLDNLSGCGKHFESRIEDGFHEFIISLIQKLISLENPAEIKSFIDTLMWRYSTADHKFLVEQALFLLIWGSYNSTIKNSWGKALKNSIDLPKPSTEGSNSKSFAVLKDIKPHNFEFTCNVLELFEILANICLEKATLSQFDKQKLAEKNNLLASSSSTNKAPVNIKFPNLERTISSIDDNSSESLITHILDVIFGEASNAINSYLKYRGISYRLWQQYEIYEEEKKDEKKKKKKERANRREVEPSRGRGRGRVRGFLHRRRNSDSYFPGDDDIDMEMQENEESEDEEDGAMGDLFVERVNSNRNNLNENDAKDKENKDGLLEAEEERPYYYDLSDKINIYDELRSPQLAVNKAGLNSKVNCSVNELLAFVYKQNEVIYDPEFLNRLLIILYKCSMQYQNEKILFNIANPLNFCVLFKLIRICSTPEKILITKILTNTTPYIPEDIIVEGIDMFLKDSEYDSFVHNFTHKRKNYGNFDNTIFIEFVIDLIQDIRIKSWNNERESNAAYVVSCQLINLLRTLWQTECWKDNINRLFKDLINFDDASLASLQNLENVSSENLQKYLRRETIIGIFGGDYLGLAAGSEVKVKTEISNNTIDLDFIKKDYLDHFSIGTVLGFIYSSDDIWSKKASKDNKVNKKTDKPFAVYITPNNTVDMQVCVLLNDSILNDDYNMIDISPKVYNQNQLIISQPKINFDNLQITSDDLEKIFLFIISDKNQANETPENMSALVNLKTAYLRFVDKILKTSKGVQLFGNMKQEVILSVIKELAEISNRKVIYGSHLLNLDLLEEKRFRIINFCLENKASLNELSSLTIGFRKPNHLIIRVYKDQLINIRYSISAVSNFDLLNTFTEYLPLEVDSQLLNSEVKNKEKSEFIITAYEKLEHYLVENPKKLIITSLPQEGKFHEAKYKKFENSSIVILDYNSFNELITIYDDFMNKKLPLKNVPAFKNIFTQEYEKEKADNLNKEVDLVEKESEKTKAENAESNEFIENLVNELENFGFEPEVIRTEAIKLKDQLNINDLLSNLIEYKEKAKNRILSDENKLENIELNIDENAFIGPMLNPNSNQNDDSSDESKKKNPDDNELDDEHKNECFNTKEEEKMSIIPEFYEDMLIAEKADNYLIYNVFKSLNDKILILYARRIIITLLSKFIENLENESADTKAISEVIISQIPGDCLLKNLKLLTNEGLFSNTVNFGSELLLEIKSLLVKIFSNNKNKHVNLISEKLTKLTFEDLEKILNGKIQNYDFYTINEESILNKPVLFFAIWNLMIMNEHSNRKAEHIYTFNILSGVVLKIKDNKQIRWFLIDLLIQFTHKLYAHLKDDMELMINLSSEKSLKNIENINKLRLFLDESISKESKKNLSKRSQMICELLIYLEELEAKINQLSGKGDDHQLSNLLEVNIKKDNFIIDLLTTFEMMKEFFDKKYLKYLAWTEMNPEIINSSKTIFESPHLYSKAPHTILVNIPNSISIDVNIFSDTLLDNGDAIVFSLDKNANYPIECYANRSSKKNFTIQSSHLFVHFPSNYLNEVYSFGSNSSGRLGHSGNDIYTPKLIESLSSFIIKDICIGDTFVLVLTTNGELYAAGTGVASGLKQSSNTFTKSTNINNPDKINSSGISFISSNQASTIMSTKENTLYSIGLNTNGQLGQGWNSPINDITSMNFTKKIKSISISDTHTMMLSSEGQIYHLGNNDYYQSGELCTTRNNTPKLVDLGKEYICQSVSAGDYFSIFVMYNTITKKTNAYSSGFNKNGRNGFGKDDESSQSFKIISCLENENYEFKNCVSSKTCSALITTNGKLFTWGLNTKGLLGFGHFNNILEPILVTFFDKFEVLDVSLSVDHMLVLVKDTEKNKISVYGSGDYSNGLLGETITQKTEKKDCIATPIKISFFEGKNPYKLVTGPRASIVMCRIKPYEELRDSHSHLANECDLCAKQPISGNLFIELFQENEQNQLNYVQDKEIKYYCNACIKVAEMSSKVPRLLIKNPLKDYSLIKDFIKKPNLLPKLNLPILEEENKDNCKNCKEGINFSSSSGYQYIENKSVFSICNNCIDAYPSSITGPKVYLRTFNRYKSMDITNVNHYYENSISYGYKFSITPTLNEKGSELIIEKNLNSFNSFVEEINEFNRFEVYEQLVDLLNNMAQKFEKSIFTMQPKDLTFKKEELSVRGSLEKCSSDLLRKMFVILKTLNTRVKDLLPFIDFSKVLQDNQRMSYHFNKITPLIFWDTKFELIKFYLEKTCTEYECSEIKINRMKSRRFIEKGKPDHTGEFTVFGQLFQFLRTKSFKIFKKREGGNNNKMFNVTFVGEASIDAGKKN